MNNVTRIFDVLDRYRARPFKEDALCFKRDGNWVKFSSADYIDYAFNFCYGLYEMGLGKGDMIVTVSTNRPEWNFTDVGMSMLGVVNVPVFTSLNTSEYEYIIKNSGAKMVIVSDASLYRNVAPALKAAGDNVKVFSFDRVEGLANWMEIVEKGRSAPDETRNEVEKIKNGIEGDTFAVLIYTSGTTGKPKGVMLSHRNLTTNFMAAASVFNLKTSDRYLSILPLCHVGGRLGNYQTQYSGAGIYYAENMGTIAANMQEIKPDGFDAVPRILEKFYSVIISKGNKLTGIKKKLFFWAVSLGSRYKPFGGNGWLYEKKLGIADRLIFSKWRAALGNNVSMVGCGGASLQPLLERIFWAAGIKIINMYGLTETSPIITINRTTEGYLRLGSVGAVIDGAEVKIAEDGEILCRGQNLMIGYYSEPELTRAAVDSEGWFHTGDIGYLEEEKFLMVTDRKNEMFKLSNGKFIAPQLIENTFKQSPLIDQIMVVGSNEKFTSALISPYFKHFEELREAGRLSFADNQELVNSPEIHSMIGQEVDKINNTLNPFEKVVRFKLVPDEWSPGTGELSPTLKLKRQFISDKYQSLVDQIYRK